MLDDLPPPILVEDGASFERLLGALSSSDEIAVDTEADSFFNYREKVCLVQVTVGDVDYLVDPQAGFDLAPLGRVLADPARTKIFHDGEYDVLILKRDYSFSFAGLFDTRVAAAALGYENPGLASVLKDVFEVELDKSQQRSDWSRRPLTQRQIAYARLDTHFLIPLKRHFEAELERRQRRMVVDGECRRLEGLDPAERAFDPDEFLRLKGARSLSLLEMRVLRELYCLREGRAKARNVPPFKVLSNPLLIELARRQPRSSREVARMKGFPPRVVRSLGADVLAAIERGLALGPLPQLPRLPSRDGTGELTEQELELHERLRAWRKRRAQKDGLDSSLVLNRHTLLALARARPRDERALAAVDGLLEWQRERFGAEILELVARFERDVASGGVPAPPWRRSGRRGRGG